MKAVSPRLLLVSLFVVRQDRSDVVALDLRVVPVGADGQADLDCGVLEVLVRIRRTEGLQVELRIELSERVLGAACTVAGQDRVPMDSALALAQRIAVGILLAVVVHELEGPVQHGVALAGVLVLDAVDPATVGTTGNRGVADGLRFGEVDDLRQLAVLSVLVLGAVLSGPGVERRCLVRLLRCLPSRGCGGCVAACLRPRRCRWATRRGRAACCCSVDRSHSWHPPWQCR